MSNPLRNEPAWSGWYRRRPGSLWQRLCQAESWDETWHLLSATVQVSGDLLVLPSHRHPDGPRAETLGRE